MSREALGWLLMAPILAVYGVVFAVMAGEAVFVLFKKFKEDPAMLVSTLAFVAFGVGAWLVWG